MPILGTWFDDDDGWKCESLISSGKCDGAGVQYRRGSCVTFTSMEHVIWLRGNWPAEPSKTEISCEILMALVNFEAFDFMDFVKVVLTTWLI